MRDIDIEIYEAEHQPVWLLDLENSDTKVRCRSDLKRRILRGFKKSMRQKLIAESDADSEHWVDNHNGTISCSYCHTWFNKDDRYSYMRYCPYCKMKLVESEVEE